MNYPERPDPDVLLASLQHAQAREGRGKLKIFLGMAAGVGKTYAMLEAAQQQLKDGIQVVVGVVETHGRVETEALLRDLDVVPRLQIEYRGHTLQEMNLDAILQRHPQLVLVDELAHTNAPGVRHPKRYQDIVELLDAGINVYTTLNVQHLESRADTVRQITGITVRETVPDSIVDLADEVELIDLTPEELRQRLGEGKVYVAESAEVAAKNFFRVGNLTALREMALRLTAERVDHQLQDYMSLKRIAGPWKSGERMMVAVSPSPLAERLVRWTRRMAYNLGAPWLAVNVETSQVLPENIKAQLNHNLSLARELGGEVVTTTDENIVDGLLRVARERNVTQIIVGKPECNVFVDLLRGGALVDRLIRTSGDLDIYVVTGDMSQVKRGARPGDVYMRLAHTARVHPFIRSDRREYIGAALVVAAITGINLWARLWISPQTVGLILLLTISLLAFVVGRGPVLLAAVLSAVLWVLLFVPRIFTLDLAGIENTLTLGLYFIIALATGFLRSRLRAQEQAARYREKRTAALYALAHAIASAASMDSILKSAVKEIGKVFDAEVAFLLRDEGNQLAYDAHPDSTLKVDEKERSVAMWAFLNRKPAGRFTDTLPMANARWLPLITPDSVVGVMGVRAREQLSVDQESLLETFASQVALAIEREMLEQARERTVVVSQSEELYRNLLESVTQEIRAPISTITHAAASLDDSQLTNQIETRNALVEQTRTAAERLNRLMENLVDLTRLESGMLKPQLEWCNVGNLVRHAIQRLGPYLAPHEVIEEIAPNLPQAQIDSALMERALLNLIHNAATHTPPNTRVRVSAKVEGTDLVLAVSDRGPGVAPELLPKIFDKYYHAPDARRDGLGLGLSITRGMVEAQGGTITAENRTRGGISFIIRLPLTRRAPPVAEKKDKINV
ncbi:MAG: sensor histidine kinase KdpD [Chloroflexi bacterium]|nr:sensor histidine kinase KdpD [Chloroflexota bacterium]